MKYILSICLSALVFLSGFSSGPELHYCYSSGRISADISGLWGGEESHEDICAAPAGDVCCAVKAAAVSKDCCGDFEFRVELRDYSPVQVLNPVPQPVFISEPLFSLSDYLNTGYLFHAVSDVIPDPGSLRHLADDLPLFVKISVFRI